MEAGRDFASTSTHADALCMEARNG